MWQRLIFVAITCFIYWRGLVYLRQLLDNASVRQFIRKRSYLYPNNICYARMILTGVAMVLYYFGHQYSGVAIYLLAVFSDAADGMIARKCDLITAWGKMLDPLADKVICLPPMAFFANGGQLSVGLVIIFATIELIGQFGVRGILAYLKKDMAANDYGKVKTVTAFILIISVFVFQDVNINFIQNSAMLILCVLASCSVLFKIIPAKS